MKKILRFIIRFILFSIIIFAMYYTMGVSKTADKFILDRPTLRWKLLKLYEKNADCVKVELALEDMGYEIPLHDRIIKLSKLGNFESENNFKELRLLRSSINISDIKFLSIKEIETLNYATELLRDANF